MLAKRIVVPFSALPADATETTADSVRLS